MHFSKQNLRYMYHYHLANSNKSSDHTQGSWTTALDTAQSTATVSHLAPRANFCIRSARPAKCVFERGSDSACGLFPMLRCKHSLVAFRLYPGPKTNTHQHKQLAERTVKQFSPPVAHLEKAG